SDHLRSFHHQQAERIRPGACHGREDHQRSWRGDRVQLLARRHNLQHLHARLASGPTGGASSVMSKGSILIADDDAAIRTILNQAFYRAGYEVRVAANAATLWQWIGEGAGDAVVTDVM